MRLHPAMETPSQVYTPHGPSLQPSQQDFYDKVTEAWEGGGISLLESVLQHHKEALKKQCPSTGVWNKTGPASS